MENLLRVKFRTLSSDAVRAEASRGVRVPLFKNLHELRVGGGGKFPLRIVPQPEGAPDLVSRTVPMLFEDGSLIPLSARQADLFKNLFFACWKSEHKPLLRSKANPNGISLSVSWRECFQVVKLYGPQPLLYCLALPANEPGRDGQALQLGTEVRQLMYLMNDAGGTAAPRPARHRAGTGGRGRRVEVRWVCFSHSFRWRSVELTEFGGAVG